LLSVRAIHTKRRWLIAIKFHVETFGPEEIDVEPPILEAFIAEAGVAV